MMMETVVYSREYLFVKELYDKGELGRIQFLRGSHQQDMDGWPDYWPGLPPMYYATHCVSPCLALLGKHAEHVVCHGSGRIREELIPKYGSPFAVETATFKIQDSRRRRRGDPQPVRHRPPVPRELRRLRQRRSRFEWQQVEDEEPVIHTKSTPRAAPEPRDPAAGQGARLRAPAARADPPVHHRRRSRTPTHLSFLQGGGHGGSHPHLVHNFLLAVPRRAAGLARRRRRRANWTMVGICAHESALKDGEKIAIPSVLDSSSCQLPAAREALSMAVRGAGFGNDAELADTGKKRGAGQRQAVGMGAPRRVCGR